MCIGTKQKRQLKPGVKPCQRVHGRRGHDRALCEIRRAARHFHVSRRELRYVAWCESRYRWWIRGHHQGMFQYLWSTWRSLPFRHRSVYHPRWASLATAYAWSIGRRGEWAC